VGSPSFLARLPGLVFGLVFVLVALYNAVARFVHDASIRARTSYETTDRRGLILTALGAPRLVSLDLGDLGRLIITAGPDGRGTTAFGVTPPGPHWWQSRWALATVPLALLMIGHPEEVAERIRPAALSGPSRLADRQPGPSALPESAKSRAAPRHRTITELFPEEVVGQLGDGFNISVAA
jgi:hypothetical protein